MCRDLKRTYGILERIQVRLCAMRSPNSVLRQLRTGPLTLSAVDFDSSLDYAEDDEEVSYHEVSHHACLYLVSY
jgi:hypothetical protein